MIKLTDCCNAPRISFRSTNKYICSSCNKKYDWFLKDNQKPLIGNSRDSDDMGIKVK